MASQRLTESKISAYLPAALHDELREVAESHDRPVARELRNAIAAHIERCRAEAVSE
jgi:hypothetical protein